MQKQQSETGSQESDVKNAEASNGSNGHVAKKHEAEMTHMTSALIQWLESSIVSRLDLMNQKLDELSSSVPKMQMGPPMGQGPFTPRAEFFMQPAQGSPGLQVFVPPMPQSFRPGVASQDVAQKPRLWQSPQPQPPTLTQADVLAKLDDDAKDILPKRDTENTRPSLLEKQSDEGLETSMDSPTSGDADSPSAMRRTTSIGVRRNGPFRRSETEDMDFLE